MTLIEFVLLSLVLALAVLVGMGISCHRINGALKMPATRRQLLARVLLSDKARQALPKALGGGGGGPIQPF